MDDNKECLPVASLRNVTETLALGIRSIQVQFRHSVELRRRCFRRCVDQIVRHDASPLLHPLPQRLQVLPTETIRFGRLQSVQQYHRVQCGPAPEYPQPKGRALINLSTWNLR